MMTTMPCLPAQHLGVSGSLWVEPEEEQDDEPRLY